jgi:hypothetical protein
MTKYIHSVPNFLLLNIIMNNNNNNNNNKYTTHLTGEITSHVAQIVKTEQLQHCVP